MHPYKKNLRERTFSVQPVEHGALVRIGGAERVIMGNADEIRLAASRMARWPAHVAFTVLEGVAE